LEEKKFRNFVYRSMDEILSIRSHLKLTRLIYRNKEARKKIVEEAVNFYKFFKNIPREVDMIGMSNVATVDHFLASEIADKLLNPFFDVFMSTFDYLIAKQGYFKNYKWWDVDVLTHVIKLFIAYKGSKGELKIPEEWKWSGTCPDQEKQRLKTYLTKNLLSLIALIYALAIINRENGWDLLWSRSPAPRGM